jgi:glutathione S-transferase
MIKIYGYPKTRSTRITWLLEELGMVYEFKLVDLNKGGNKSPEFLMINPAGKIPALVDDDLVMTESAAIVTYLADKYAEKGLIPMVATVERATYDQWSYFALCELEQPLWTIGKHKFALQADKRVKDVIPTAEWEFQNALALLSNGLGDKLYILGDHFSGVDILLGQTLFWAIAFKQPVEQINVRAYIERLKGRKALTRAWSEEESSLNCF